MKLGSYIMPPEPISAAYIINSLIDNTNITAFQIAEEKPLYHATWTYFNIAFYKSHPSVIPTLQPLKLLR
jgi:hypothetical protein